MPEDEKKTEKKELTEEEEFDLAFDEAFDKVVEDTTADGDEDGTKTSESETDKEDDQQEDVKETEGEEKTEPQGEGIPNVDDQADGYKTLYESAKTEVETLKSEVASLTQKMRSWEGRITKANERADEAEKKLKDPKTSSDKELEDVQEEDEAVKSFMEEFPDFKKPIMVIAKKVAKKLIDDELKDIKPSIEEVKATFEVTNTEQHYQKIANAHSDWKEIYNSGKLQAWIDGQPSFMKSKLNDIVQTGEADDIIEMFNLYKQSHAPKEKVTNPQVKDKAKNIMAVKSGQSGPKATTKRVDKDDFDAAWDEAMAKDK